MRMTGQCLCGKLTYSADAEPALVCVCHCKSCQRQAGAAFATLVIIPNETFKMVGESKIFAQPGGSGQPVERRFCPDCGSPCSAEQLHRVQRSWVPLTQNTQNFPQAPS
jgi:hypothetical protein